MANQLKIVLVVGLLFGCAAERRANRGGDGGVPARGVDGGERPSVESDAGATETADAGPDIVGPKLINAASPDGTKVVARFSEAIAPGSVTAPTQFKIRGSDNRSLTVENVQVRDRFATIALAGGQPIDPSLTYELLVQGVTDLAGNEIDRAYNRAPIKRSVYLAIVWHQHQPSYHDPAKDELQGPWVRKHATKDYYDMAAILAGYPNVHLTINLTPVLLMQLQMYVDRLGPFVDKATNRVRAAEFLAAWRGKTDPWVDLLLTPTPEPAALTDYQRGLFYKEAWATVSTADPIAKRFPEYKALIDKNRATYTKDDLLALKCWFEIAWFDPDFLRGAVTLPDGAVVNLSDLVLLRDDKYFQRRAFTEDDANRLAAENAKVMANVVPIHKQLRYRPTTAEGQIEIITTPYYHPILPLLVDSDLARAGQPLEPMPSPAFQFAADGDAHVVKAVRMYADLFGEAPRGMWPGEGSVAEAVVGAFTRNGVKWIATDQHVLERSRVQTNDKPVYYPYRVDTDSAFGPATSRDGQLLIAFRDNALSDKVGFAFQNVPGETAADEFLRDVLGAAPPFGAPARLVTVVLDGENAWEQFKEHDAKPMFHALYRKLSEAYETGEIVTVAVSEYMEGNAARGVAAHPVEGHREIEPLWAGSWIDASFSTWIGESEENQAWGYLVRARADLERSGLARPNPSAPAPLDRTSRAYNVWRAWEEMYAAEGSDWFWWYGSDQTSAANDDSPFDRAFRSHLAGMYNYANLAGANLAVPDFAPIVQAEPQSIRAPFAVPPTLDGAFTPNETEWIAAGGFFFDNDSPGAVKSPDDDIAVVYSGYDAAAFYVAILANEDLGAKLGSPYGLFVYFSQKHVLNADTGEATVEPANPNPRFGDPLQFNAGGAARELWLDLAGPAAAVKWSKASGCGGAGATCTTWASATHGITVGGPVTGGRLVEVRIPWVDLAMTPGDPLELAVVAVEGTRVVDRAPFVGGQVIFEDRSNLVYVTFEVDVSGAVVPIDTYISIATPPTPRGTGTVFISGNHEKLANWHANKISLRDDGVAPDKVAGDNIWTITVGLPPLSQLKYKYTIGLPSDYDKWTNTEEFPLTNRGFTVEDADNDRKVIVRDTFADRPQPSGTTGRLTVIPNR